ncbi:MAG: carotenoid oxygenase family protein [Myxococcales bacterium]|nr:carotenoid oxygenase family protein [Myxococcales bacterium]
MEDLASKSRSHREIYTSGNFAPIFEEHTLGDLEVRGELPRWLRGGYYRNGPNPKFPVAHDYHWFWGDGMVHAFFLEDGKATYRNRWLQTNKFVEESQAGRRLFGTFGNPYDGWRRLGKIGNVANTSVVSHGGRLFALEEASQPFLLDPKTLASKGSYDFDGHLRTAMTAHPKIDPATGELISFSYIVNAQRAWRPEMVYQVIDAQGNLKQCDIFEVPYKAMVHDFIVSSKHVAFPILPMRMSFWRWLRGRHSFAWEEGLGAHIGVMRRGGTARELTWFRGPDCYVYHVLNAYSEGDDVLVADVIKYDVAPLFGRADGRSTPREKQFGRLVRWRFDLAAGTDVYTEELLLDPSVFVEFPRLDERFAGLSYRYGYIAAGDAKADEEGFGRIVQVDVYSGDTRFFVLPEGDKAGEPTFVPRSPEAKEGDGVVLVLVYRAKEDRSELVILPGKDISQGPLASVLLPHRVPFGFHGCWVGDEV